MGRYFFRRVIQTIPLMLIISILVFLFIHMIPGDPARTLAGKDADVAEVQAIREQLGLNDNIFVQYIKYMGRIFGGDFGQSYKSGIPTTQLIGERMQNTIRLVLSAMLWAPLLGILFGVLSAVHRGGFVDHLLMFIAILGLSAPGFWLGLMGIQVFAVNLGWLPVSGLNGWKGLILPSFVMGIGCMAEMARYARSSMLDVMREDYVRTARAKGQVERKVIFFHAFRNALIQIVTILGLQIGALLSGSVLTETVFSIPGIGRLLVDSIFFRDYPVIQALLMLFAFQYVVINLIVDVLYGFINPKIRLE